MIDIQCNVKAVEIDGEKQDGTLTVMSNRRDITLVVLHIQHSPHTISVKRLDLQAALEAITHTQ